MREVERKQHDAIQPGFRARHKAIDGTDVQLNEIAHILFDAVGMIKADPELASDVLSYGG